MTAGGSEGESNTAPLDKPAIERNLDSIRDRISAAASRAGRSAEDVQLVAVTKSVGIDAAQTLYDLGVTHLGENRVELAVEKIAALPDSVTWHMIGNIQRRKARDAVELFDRIDSVDRLELAKTLEGRCEAAGKRMPVLLEVNVSGEASKHGFGPSELSMIIERIGEMDHLRLEGLMTMAPLSASPEDARPHFARLRELAVAHRLTTLSMGMTHDFEVAVEEGATEVRIGTALFKTDRTLAKQ